MMTEKHPTGYVLQAFHDGELDRAEAARIAEHCTACPDCRDRLAELDQVRDLLAGDPQPELSRTVWHRVQARRRGASRDNLRLGPAFTAVAAAACVAGIVIGIWFGPLQFAAQDKTTELAWSESSSLWGAGSSATLLDVFTLDQE